MDRPGTFSARLLSLLALMGGPLSAAEVEVNATTLARYWTQEVPGLEAVRYAPLTQFVGVDARNLGEGAWSLHLFGWGQSDLADPSHPEGKGQGDLTYGYLQYRAPKANAEVKLGRFTAQGAAGLEMVDGFSARADLRGGFTVAVFGGKPVVYDAATAPPAEDRAFMGGARLAWRSLKFGEIGVSYLRDGEAPDPAQPALADRSRELYGADFRLAPHATLEVNGRVLYRRRPEDGATQAEANLAGQDYGLSWKVTPAVQVSGSYVERDFREYFAGTNLPSLFRRLETEKYKAHAGILVFGVGGSKQLSLEVRQTRREGNGDSTRVGAEFRGSSEALKLKSGVAYHRVTATDVPLAGGTVAFYSLAHHEARVWVARDTGRFLVSLDVLAYRFDDAEAPVLHGEPNAYLGVASAGWRPKETLTVSADLSYGINPLYEKEVRGLLRLEYRFTGSTKRGAK